MVFPDGETPNVVGPAGSPGGNCASWPSIHTLTEFPERAAITVQSADAAIPPGWPSILPTTVRWPVATSQEAISPALLAATTSRPSAVPAVFQTLLPASNSRTSCGLAVSVLSSAPSVCSSGTSRYAWTASSRAVPISVPVIDRAVAANCRAWEIRACSRASLRCPTARMLATMLSTSSTERTVTAARASRRARRCCRTLSPISVSRATPRSADARSATRSPKRGSDLPISGFAAYQRMSIQRGSSG